MATKNDYSEKLKHPKWQKKRLEVLKRDKFKCKLCSDTETTLNIHHLKYNGNPWEIDNSDLVTICEHCHNEVERLKKEYGNEFDFSKLFISKSNSWTNNSTLIFISYKDVFSFRIYDSDYNFIEGYNIPYYLQCEIKKILNKAINY
jgi:hypothetical protein